MNEIRRRDRDAEEIARIREIVGRHAFPSFVTGFDVRLGEFDGDPAMWIVFKRAGDEGLDTTDLVARADIMNEFKAEVQSDLLAELGDRFPYFRSEPAGLAISPET